ncbi:MAG TPA: PSD1 and planctomycete cytochrome C domain-containing protein [Gemmata sp.]
MRIGFTLSAVVALGTAHAAPAADPVTFEQHVRPILKAYCLDCHGAGEKMSGDLDLRLKRFALAGGSSGPALVPKEPGKSPLVERMKSGEMPPGEKKVPADQIALVEKWIAGGARTVRDEPAALPPGLGITAEERAYWFYQPLKRPAVPAFGPGDRVRTPIDALVLAKLREKGLGFNADADRATLIRRAAFDLTGLPPTPAEIEAFLADRSPGAYERVLDRLLASPAYGERWGRHWLDTVGYADSDGDGAVDTVRPFAWRYRDYVIRALNADKPLNRFVVEQLAGDELVPRPWTNLKPEQIELLAATGFLRTAPDGTASGGTPADAEQVVTDTLKIVTSGLLGTSVACAQCHDHRYDPVPQADYYQLRAVFEPALDPGKWRRPGARTVSLYTDADRAKAAAVDAEAAKLQAAFSQKQTAAVRAAFEKELEKFPAAERPKLRAAFDTPAGKRTGEQQKLVAANPKLNVTPGVLYQYDTKADAEVKALQAQVQAKRAERPVEQFVAVMTEVPGRVPVTKLFHRGDARQPKGPDLAPADLTISAPEGKRFEVAPKGAPPATTGRRLAWAEHLTSGTHPQFGRVMANRIWLNHFGRGIVDTPGEFGKLGQLPTHPELLDWLATELADPDRKDAGARPWGLKRFHKLIMTSTVYRQSSAREPAKSAADGANALYGRFPVRRLEAEAVRDRILTVAGRLDRTPFGPPVAVAEDAAGQVGTPDDKPRRSVYLQARRSKPVAFLTTFDAPAGELHCERRNATTTAPQALMLLNSAFVRTQAGYVANRVRAEAQADPTPERLVETAWRLAYLRPPAADELKLGTTFLKAQTAALQGKSVRPELAALTNLCQQLLASNEFLYVD